MTAMRGTWYENEDWLAGHGALCLMMKNYRHNSLNARNVREQEAMQESTGGRWVALGAQNLKEEDFL